MKLPNKHGKQHRQKKKALSTGQRRKHISSSRRDGVKFLTEEIVLRVSFPVESSLETFTTVGKGE